MALYSHSLVPPIPPRPHSSASTHHTAPILGPPQVPPLPPDLRRERADLNQHTRFTNPPFAPLPQRFNPDIPPNMARTLGGHHVFNAPHFATPQPAYNTRQMSLPAPNHNFGFTVPGAQPLRSTSSVPPPPQAIAGWTSPQKLPQVSSMDVGRMAASMTAVTLHDNPLPRAKSVHGMIDYSVSAPHQHTPSTSLSAGPLQLTAPLPTMSSLQAALPYVQSSNADSISRVAWIRDVLLVVSRTSAMAEGASTSTSSSLSLMPSLPSGPVRIADSALQRLADVATPLLISLVPTLPDPGQTLAPCTAEALFLRATLTASGAFPEYIPASPRNAFREFELAARAGHAPAWFRLGRDYESVNDTSHACQCFERGIAVRDEGCAYRLGMARLLGQLGLPCDVPAGIDLLRRAAEWSSITCPQPAYVYALLLLDDCKQVSVPPAALAPFIPMGSTPAHEARAHLERAAFLHFVPAQLRLGHGYEFAEIPFSFDPLLSVQYYSLASQQGEPEADMALSKWFLCGADGPGGFAKDEGLAYMFAEKAARKGHPSAEFAIGYYSEVGIGTPRDVQKAIEWYEMVIFCLSFSSMYFRYLMLCQASARGNTDASARLAVLAGPTAQTLSREQHDTITEHKLVRKRTQAKQRFENASSGQLEMDQHYNIQAQPQPQIFKPRQASLSASLPTSGVVPTPYQYFNSPPQQIQPQRMPQHANSLPSQTLSPFDNSGFGTPPPPQQFADRPRFTLVDAGLAGFPSSDGPPGNSVDGHRAVSVSAHQYTSGLPPKRHQFNGGSPGAPQGTGMLPLPPNLSQSPLPQSSSPVPSTASNRTGGTRYNTFAEMGIEGRKAEDKECLIM
ncbi:hypothetical protein EW145_g2252 [Phellinidium pouzarii]|uniref:HCP-like protein n=1 Tax=Phellinidium pouzarii TaxID=167371 RepID=A0A4S4LC44_9AGAM|nr:hypothetical protein EW145_g2252 [Phellinidium pouzarii]